MESLARAWWRFQEAPLLMRIIAPVFMIVTLVGGVAFASTLRDDTTVVNTPNTTIDDSGPSLPQGDDARIAAIIDGVDVELETGAKVRLIGVRLPEPTDLPPCYIPGAAEFIKKNLPPGTPVRLAYDQSRLDGEGRRLAYVYRMRDAWFANAQLLRAGHAKAVEDAPNTLHTSMFNTFQQRAVDSKVGVWDDCGDTTTSSSTPIDGEVIDDGGDTSSTTRRRTTTTAKPRPVPQPPPPTTTTTAPTTTTSEPTTTTTEPTTTTSTTNCRRNCGGTTTTTEEPT